MKMLAADIGGTKSWLAVLELEIARAPQCLFEQKYASADFASLSELLQHFLKSAPVSVGHLDVMSLALPGVICADAFRLTNLDWLIDREELEQTFSLKKLILLNDFAAVAAGISTLKNPDYVVLNAAKPATSGVRVVTGAGTGLGLAWMLNLENQHYDFATEGGHIDFAPASKRQANLWAFLAKKYGHVSYERILSGEGLVQLYHFCHATGTSTTLESAADVSLLADTGDKAAIEALSLFIEIYGAFIGNVALLYRPQAGIYIAGGIGAKLQSQMQSSHFIQSAFDKGRMRKLVEQTPIYLVTNQRLGLQGVMQAGISATGDL